MIDVNKNFIASIRSLENFNREYIQVNRDKLEKQSTPEQLYPNSTVIPLDESIDIDTTQSLIINDYIRMCRMYCVMLWTYCDATDLKNRVNLEELKLIRHCIIHHEGNMVKYSQDKDYGNQGRSLITKTQGKSYAQNNHLIISDSDLVTFTELVKLEFKNKTGLRI